VAADLHALIDHVRQRGDDRGVDEAGARAVPVAPERVDLVGIERTRLAIEGARLEQAPAHVRVERLALHPETGRGLGGRILARSSIGRLLGVGGG
jgi:hypothetical protein